MAGVLLTGCLVVPLPGDEKKVLRGSAVGDWQITKVEIGRTTRKEVEQTLGRPRLLADRSRRDSSLRGARRRTSGGLDHPFGAGV